jgi:hypothetical protein
LTESETHLSFAIQQLDFSSENLVKVVAWVHHPRTMTAALRIAKSRESTLSESSGSGPRRPREDEEWGIERGVVGALRSAIHEHGPITLENIGSAARRIVGNAVNTRGDGEVVTRSALGLFGAEG